MIDDKTLCLGECSYSRVCARRNSCRRYVAIKNNLPPREKINPMLCRPTIMLIGDASEQRNAYIHYIPVTPT